MNVTYYESALEFRELSDFQNVPNICGRYEADQRVAALPNIFADQCRSILINSS